MDELERICKRCGQYFKGDPLFVTCINCRKPVVNSEGGCKHWENMGNDDIRVHRHPRTNTIL